MREPKFLCLDGPLNGDYATAAEAAPLGYNVERWPGTNEDVLVQGGVESFFEPDELDEYEATA